MLILGPLNIYIYIHIYIYNYIYIYIYIYVIMSIILLYNYIRIITSMFTLCTKQAGTSEIPPKHQVLPCPKIVNCNLFPQLLHFEVPPCKADLRPANPQFDATTIGHHENSCCSWPWPPGNEGSRLKRIRKGTLLEESNVISSCMSCIVVNLHDLSEMAKTMKRKNEMAGSR